MDLTSFLEHAKRLDRLITPVQRAARLLPPGRARDALYGAAAAAVDDRRQPGVAAVRLRLLRQHDLQPGDQQAGLTACHPNTTTFVYPAEIFPVEVRATGDGIAAAADKLGAFAGTYVLTALLPAIGLSMTSGIVAGVAVLGLLVTVTLLPGPKGVSLEKLTEVRPGR